MRYDNLMKNNDPLPMLRSHLRPNIEDHDILVWIVNDRLSFDSSHQSVIYIWQPKDQYDREMFK